MGASATVSAHRQTDKPLVFRQTDVIKPVLLLTMLLRLVTEQREVFDAFGSKNMQASDLQDPAYQRAVLDSLQAYEASSAHAWRLQERADLYGLTQVDTFIRCEGNCAFDAIALAEYQRTHPVFDRTMWEQSRAVASM